MLTVQIPVNFLKGLAETGYTDVWIRWITTYGEKVKEPFFMEGLAKAEKHLDSAMLEKLKTIYHWGQPYLQALYFVKAKKVTKKSKKINASIQQNAERVLNYLNLRTGVEHGKIKKEPALKDIKQRLEDGYTIWDCKSVIDKKWQDWKDSDLVKHMVPHTLFGIKHFDSYLNQPITNGRQRKESPGSNFQSLHGVTAEAIEVNRQMVANKAGNTTGQGD